VSRAVSVLAVIGALAVAIVGSAESLRLYRARSRFDAARTLYHEEGRNPGPEAMALLESSIALAPGDPDPHFLLGRIAARLRRHDEALAHLEDAEALNPFDGRTHYYLGRACWDLNEEDRAVQAMERAGTLSLNNPDHLYQIGYFYWFLWEWENKRKITNFRKAFERLTESFRYFRLASRVKISYLIRVLRLTQKWNIPYTNVKEVVPDTPEAHHQAGRYFGHERGLWEPALREFELAGDALDDRWNFLLDRGLARLFRKQDPFPDLRLAIKTAPERNNTIRSLHFFFSASRRAEDGLSFWIELEKAYPELPGPVVNRTETELGFVKVSMKEPMKALEAELKASLSAARSGAEKKAVHARFEQAAKKRWGDALHDVENHILERLSRIAFRQEAKLYRLKAEVMGLQHRFGEAELAFKHAAEFGNAPEYWHQYVQFLLVQGKGDPDLLDKAMKTAIQAKGLFPENAVFQRLIDLARDRLLAALAARKEDEKGDGR